MTLVSVLERVKNALYPVITRNVLLDALLGAPTDEIAVAEAKIEAWSYGADDIVEGAELSLGTGSSLVTLSGGTTDQFIDGDEIVIAGSVEGNSGRYSVIVVNSTQLILSQTSFGGGHTVPFAAIEPHLYYGLTKPRTIRLSNSNLSFPGGYESGVNIRANIANYLRHQLRGSTQGIINEFNRITNSTTVITDPLKQPLNVQTTTATITASGAGITPNWFPVIGTPFTITSSTTGSNGLYYVYSQGASVVPARRAVASTQYYADLYGGAELQFREDRANSRIYFRVINVNGQAQNKVGITIQVGGSAVSVGTFGSNGLNSGASEVLNYNSGTLQFTITGNGDNTWSVTPGQIKEGWFTISNNVAGATFTVTWTQTVGTIQAVRLGRATIMPRTVASVLSPGTASQFRFGGLIKTAFRGGIAETPVTVLLNSYPGYWLNLSDPGTYENDAYTIVSPEDFAVIDLDHRNYANYSEDDLKAAARDHLVPVDIDYVLGFI